VNLRSASLRFALHRVALLRSALRRRAPIKFACIKSALLRFAPLRFAPLKFACARLALLKFARIRFAPSKFALERLAPQRFARLGSSQPAVEGDFTQEACRFRISARSVSVTVFHLNLPLQGGSRSPPQCPGNATNIRASETMSAVRLRVIAMVFLLPRGEHV
jgi:hypothetical protein